MVTRKAIADTVRERDRLRAQAAEHTQLVGKLLADLDACEERLDRMLGEYGTQTE